MKSQKNLINQSNLEKKYTTGGFYDFRPHDNSIVIKTVRYWLKYTHTHTDKWYKKPINKCMSINL